MGTPIPIAVGDAGGEILDADAEVLFADQQQSIGHFHHTPPR
jgi:hypothetical protein